MSFAAGRRDAAETMAAYDDRPISVYDNLNMPPTLQPSTGIHHTGAGGKSLTPSGRAATSQLAAADSANGGVAASGAQAVFADLTFRFNDNNNSSDRSKLATSPSSSYGQHQQQQQQFAGAQRHQQHTLPIELQSSLPNGDNPHYSHPYSGGKQVGPAPPQQQQQQQSHTFAPTPSPPSPQQSSTTPNERIGSTTSPVGAVRPLSQHSQSEPNETSQNIAAVKAALNDAKSKFFGLNGYSSSQTHAPPQHMSHSPPPPSASSSSSRHQPLLDPDSGGGPSRPQVHIVPPKPQPKYQNIPENSAIFRTPPELPPKPKAMQPQHQQQQQHQPQPASDEEPVVQPATKILPYSGTATMYQQIPLNDIDAAHPSQAVYMTTTVPQNIKGSKIAGRHTPTRNSLRHSRMLVINNKNYQVVQHPNPMNLKQPNLARWLLILQIIIGLFIAGVAGWTFILSVSTPIQDNPFWSSLALIAAGSLGLSLVRYQRIKRQKARENCFLFMRANSFVLSLLAVLLCGVACIYASIHYMRLVADDTSCVPRNVLLEHGSCLCSFHVNEAAQNRTLAGVLAIEEAAATSEPELSYQVEYRDFSCSEVLGIWVSILRCSMSLNALGFVVSLVYIMLLACCRYDSKRMYSSVHVSSF